jgi:hypothetical protein
MHCLKFAKFFENGRAAGLWLLVLLLSVGLAPPADPRAQASGPSGTLTGAVRDQNGSAVPGAAITARNTGTGLTRSINADEGGNWTIPALPVGTYQVTIEAQGFKRTLLQNVEVEAATPRTLDARLEVGDIAAGEVLVVADVANVITPDTATTSRQISGTELVEVPTSTRSFTHLLSAEAGVSSDLPPVLTNGNGNISPSVNGTRTTSTSLFFNGVDATNVTSNEGSLTDNIAPAPETLSEVKLQTSLYDASTGRSGGGNFQLVTKSGANTFDGSAYLYLQNERFNANDFFYNKDGIEKPRARRYEGGFTVGGPVVKERFFFFGGYQRTNASTGFVPTASSVTVLPEFLGFLPADRGSLTGQAVVDAVNAARAARGVAASTLTAAQVSPVFLNLLALRNPATGGFVLPAPAANARFLGPDVSVSGFPGGDPLVEQRNVFPAEFEQDQFTVKLDGQLTENNRLSGTFFFSNFPGLDPFPDPSSLVSPFVLRRNDRNRTLVVSDQHVFGPRLINEVRFGYFTLGNTRRLDDEFLSITNEQVGIQNPATFFDASAATTRLGHFVNRAGTWSFGGPNDSFNRREQRTWSVSDNVTLIAGSHNFRLGGEYKNYRFDTNLPEEQATEFEKIENFRQLIQGFTSEADSQFGITDKSFRFRDVGLYVADDWKVNRKLTLNLGLRWEFFAWPEEENGRIGNFDPSLVADPGNIITGFLVPSNVRPTGFNAIDEAIAATRVAPNKHTLNGYDLNNFAPRFGFAYSPFESNRFILRGGYGVFYDRPSAAFINTVFSNYPFLRETEQTFPARNVPIANAFTSFNPEQGLNEFLPFRVVYRTGGTFEIRDSTGTLFGPGGVPTPTDPAGRRITGNIAETFEFRAIDRDLRTPYVQQWNLGFQQELTKNLVFEARYVGTKGTKLLQARPLNQPFDLNDANAPDVIFARLNAAYEEARAFNPSLPALRSGATARERGRGIIYCFPNSRLGGAVDCNLSNAAGAAINFEARSFFLGLNTPEAPILESNGSSIYHGAQFNLNRRVSRGLNVNLAYTFSKAIDTSSVDPGSTAGGGRPDVPNAGFVVQGDARNLRANRALSDFDRPHRFSASFVYDIPSFGSASRWATGWQVAGFAQAQSGTPYSIFSPEPEIGSASDYASLFRGSGGLFRPGFGRPDLCAGASLEDLRQTGPDVTEQAFNPGVLCSPLGGFGNLGRNALRGFRQKRFDVSLSKETRLTEGTSLQLRWDVFNAFNNVNFANPGNELNDPDNLGRIRNSVGGPRVMQFGAKVNF